MILDTPEGRQLAIHIRARIEDLRDCLECPGADSEVTEFHRGQIAALRDLLRPTPPASTKDEAPLY